MNELALIAGLSQIVRLRVYSKQLQTDVLQR